MLNFRQEYHWVKILKGFLILANTMLAFAVLFHYENKAYGSFYITLGFLCIGLTLLFSKKGVLIDTEEHLFKSYFEILFCIKIGQWKYIDFFERYAIRYKREAYQMTAPRSVRSVRVNTKRLVCTLGVNNQVDYELTFNVGSEQKADVLIAYLKSMGMRKFKA